MESVSDAIPTVVAKVVSPEIIKKVQEDASDYFLNLMEEEKKAAETFFETMDEDGDGSISVDEFTDFLTHEGFQNVNPNKLFAQLDKDNNNTLNFNELVTFFYVVSRNEYKHLLTGSPSSEVPDPKVKITPWMAGGAKAQAKINPGMVEEAKAQRWRGQITFLQGLYNKLKEVFSSESG
ncbi:hypothetical protein BT93_L5894 [Corymbia citriodora subsp. variegata]|uniref:EF-hand domain-containing protein n=1 Tax=Corymbia citriodora subsp. variegata TaxID=360336 RepID=A0A8T0CTG6_CORYI|nr:hypothetical protein BT93_L5894 [Corymbia citriodora subsp. variegata]